MSKEMTGTVEKFYDKTTNDEGNDVPYALVIAGNKYTTFDGEHFEDVDTDELVGSEVRFEWEENDGYRNIDGPVEIVDTSPDNETHGKTEDDFLTDSERIQRQSALKSAVTLFQPVMDSGDEMTQEKAEQVREMVQETAEDFYEWLQDQ